MGRRLRLCADCQKPIWGGLEDPQVRNLNRRDGRWPRPPLVSVDSFGSLCHLRWQQPTGLTLPSVPSKVNSYRPAFPGRSIFAEGADRAHRSFRSLANIGVLRAGRAQPLYLLTPPGRFALRATAHRADASLRRAAGRFGPSAQVPTGHALPFAPAGLWGRAPKPYAAAFSTSVASIRRTQETRLSPNSGVFQRSGRVAESNFSGTPFLQTNQEKNGNIASKAAT